MPQSNADIAAMNDRIAAAGDQVDMALPGSTDKLVVRAHTSPTGQKSLVLQLLNAKGVLRPSLVDRNEGPMLTFNTPLSTITSAYSVSPRRVGSSFPSGNSMEPNAAIFLGPAGDEAAWEASMQSIDAGLIKEFASTVRTEGTCIPKDALSAAIAKKAGKLSKAQFEDWFAEMLSGHGSPHMAHIGKRTVTDAGVRSGSFQFRKKLFQRADADTDTPYDSLLGTADKLAEIRESLPHKSRFAPIPIYYRNKLVTPEEYEDIADRMVGSIVYAELWAKLYSNTKNKVVSLKFGILKIVVSQLADASGRGNSVVDVCADADTAAPRPATVDVDAIMELAEGGKSAAKRARTD